MKNHLLFCSILLLTLRCASFVVRKQFCHQNSIDKHDCTSCFTKNRLLPLLQTGHISTYPKESIPRSQSFNSHRFTD